MMILSQKNEVHQTHVRVILWRCGTRPYRPNTQEPVKYVFQLVVMSIPTFAINSAIASSSDCADGKMTDDHKRAAVLHI